MKKAAVLDNTTDRLADAATSALDGGIGGTADAISGGLDTASDSIADGAEAIIDLVADTAVAAILSAPPVRRFFKSPKVLIALLLTALVGAWLYRYLKSESEDTLDDTPMVGDRRSR